ncbi:HNH endonuclease [Azospirillum argentinense]
MRRFRPNDLSKTSLAALMEYQDDVNACGDFRQRVDRADRLFSQNNRDTNKAFREVRKNLREAVGPSERCAYCEDSEANEVEHVAPKSKFPEISFKWENYAWACSQCNRPKNNSFIILDNNNNEVDLSKMDLASLENKPEGRPLALDPRDEDPMDYLYVDLTTGVIQPQVSLEGIELRRAKYTIELYQLDARTAVRTGRRNAVNSFVERLRRYVDEKNKGTPITYLQHFKSEIQSLPHQTVWEELKRQSQCHTKIKLLFQDAPEALHW